MKVRLDHDRIRDVGIFLNGIDTCAAFEWTGNGFPDNSSKHALEFFFIAVKHQFGFWLDDGKKYIEPMYGVVNGQRLKGSDFVWNALSRSLSNDQSLYDIGRQTRLDDKEIADIFSDDDGNCPLPKLNLHADLFREYASDLISLNLCPLDIVSESNSSEDSLKYILKILSEVGGYKEDPLQKKAILLAMILANRPEHFLVPKPGLEFKYPPVVDYHIQRSALRVGLVVIDDMELSKQLQERVFLDESQEMAIRQAVYDSMVELERVSGISTDALDWFFFQNRKRCPEMTDPECPKCEIVDKCAQNKNLFQPVIRTTYY